MMCRARPGAASATRRAGGRVFVLMPDQQWFAGPVPCCSRRWRRILDFAPGLASRKKRSTNRPKLCSNWNWCSRSTDAPWNASGPATKTELSPQVGTLLAGYGVDERSPGYAHPGLVHPTGPGADGPATGTPAGTRPTWRRGGRGTAAAPRRSSRYVPVLARGFCVTRSFRGERCRVTSTAMNS